MRAPSIVLFAALTLTACGDPAASDCSVSIEDVDIIGDTLSATGTFVTAQPLLFLTGPQTKVIPGVDDGRGHASFDLTGLPPGQYSYRFDASCFDAEDDPTVDAPTGFFTRT